MANVSKSLGNLFVNIGAKTGGLDQAVTSSKKKLTELSSTVTGVLAGFAKLAVGAAGTAAAVGLVTSHAIDAGEEIRNLSQQANASTAEFQRYAYAVEGSGFSQQEFAKQVKLTNDKIGQFMQTGAGPLKDFFDNIGSKVDITAKSFANLSGPQSLQLYYNGLEQANLSQQEMVFYMENIAKGSSKLIPLLANNGASISNLGKEAEELGFILSDIDLQKLDQNDPFDKIAYSVKTVSTLIGVELVPYVNLFTTKLLESAKEAGGIRVIIKNAFADGARFIGVAADAAHVLGFGFKAIELALTSVGFAIIETSWQAIDGLIKIGDYAKYLPGPFGDVARLMKATLPDMKGVSSALGESADAAAGSIGVLKSELDGIAMAEKPSEKIIANIMQVGIEADRAAEKAANMISTVSSGGGNPFVGTGENKDETKAAAEKKAALDKELTDKYNAVRSSVMDERTLIQWQYTQDLKDLDAYNAEFIGKTAEVNLAKFELANKLEADLNALDDQKIKTLLDKYQIETDLLAAHQEEMKVIGDEFDANKFDNEEQWKELKLASEEDYWAQRQAITERGNKGIIGLIQRGFGTNASETAKSLGSIFTIFSAHNKKLFKFQQAVNLGGAVMDMWRGVAAGVKLGYPMAIPAVAAALATGAKAIAGIRSASDSGGGGGGGGGSGVGMASPPEPAEAPSSNKGESGKDDSPIFTFKGFDPSKFYDGRHMGRVLQDAIDAGLKMRLEPM